MYSGHAYGRLYCADVNGLTCCQLLVQQAEGRAGKGHGFGQTTDGNAVAASRNVHFQPFFQAAQVPVMVSDQTGKERIVFKLQCYGAGQTRNRDGRRGGRARGIQA